MDKKQAQALIKETLESPFDKNRFVGFVKNLLNEVEEATFIYKGNYIPDAYEQYINTLERIGKYTDGEHKIDILVAKLKKETSIERARTMQRNFVAWYLNGSRGGEMKDAALVAFVAPDEQDWRFSLVKMDYRFEEGKKGRMRVKEEFTPARRWSFLVGANENSHTAQSQLVDLVADDERNPVLTQLEEAFNIEKVTKEFFEKYRELFLWTKETIDDVVKKDKKIKADFETKGVETVNFSKKLLGQVVFLYFLQKKGWFGVKRDAEWGTGPKNFLRELFEEKHVSYKNFFNDILEPLFYEALARERDDDFYSRFNCKIPFLNGGLFDPINNYDWVHTDILLPNDLFSNDYKTKEGDIGNGILDVFDRYNFTVKEDEPLEKEVAVDPEMLGKVFENLLEVKDRKSKGTYYTPREIVHYMCQQSLINYLFTECNLPSPLMGEGKGEGVILDEVKNPIPTKEDIEILIKFGETVSENEARVETKGKETKDYKYKLPESIRQNAELIDKKLINVKVCDPAIGSGAFPVGMMSEIVKTRNVLSAYIKNKNRTIYNFKRECIEKSLYGVDIEPGAVEIAKLRLWLSLVVDEDDIEQIKPLPNLDCKILCGNSLLGVEKDLFNSHLFSEIERLKPLLFGETNPKKKQEYKKQIDELIAQITHGHKEFDFEVYFSEVFHDKKKGFDVVVANPPYKFLSGKGSPIQDLINQGKKKEAEKLKQELTLVTRRFPNSSRGCKDFYKWFIDLGSQIIRTGGVLTYITPNTFITLPKYDDIRLIIFGKLSNKILIDLGFNIFEEPVVPSAIFISHNITKSNNRINYSDLKEVERDLLKSTDVHKLIEENLISVEFNDNNILLYKHPLAQKIYTNAEFDLKTVLKISEGEHSLKNDFSEITDANAKNSIPVINDSMIKKYVLAQIVYLPKLLCRNYDETLHTGERFFIRKTGDKIIAVPPEKFTFAVAHQNLYVAKPRNKQDVKLLVGLLSSKLMTFLYQNGIYGQKNRTMAQFRIYALYLLPIPNLKKMDVKLLINVVDEIFSISKDKNYLKNSAKQARVREYERQIDQMVYKLYGLTPEEIKLVENS